MRTTDLDPTPSAKAIMDPFVRRGHLIEACIAFVCVLVMQAVYCCVQARLRSVYRQLHLSTKPMSRLNVLVAIAVISAIFGGIFIACGVSSRPEQSTRAYAMFICCKGTSVFSIWCFEVSLGVCLLWILTDISTSLSI